MCAGHYCFDMDIRSNDSPWLDCGTQGFNALQTLTQDIQCDVAVVGAGVSGALVAAHLADKGVDVVVLDAGQPGAGSTAACTALIQYELDEPLINIAEKVSSEHATSAYQTTSASLQWIKEFVDMLDDDSGLMKRPTLLLARRRRDKSSMQKEVAARQQAGIDCTWLNADALQAQFNIDRPGAILSPLSYEIDPYRLTLAALRYAVTRGCRVFAPAFVCDYHFRENDVMLRTSHGIHVQAKQIVIATGYETPEIFRMGRGTLLSTWAVRSEPVNADAVWPQRQLMWEWGQAYLYARLMPDNRIIYGGGDEHFTEPNKRDAIITKKTTALTKQMSELINTQVMPECQWAGTFAQTEDGMPYIGPHLQSPHTYLALGYGGNGVTFSLIAARIITGLLCNDATLAEPARLFRFDR
jgi:glycine/D-amino acid oxidase-like deaminating enzyme